MLRRLSESFWHSDLFLTRLSVGIGSLVWAEILLLNGPQWERPAYVYLAQMAPQEVWGCGFLFVGLLQTVRVIVGIPATTGFYACAVAALCCFLWLCVALSLAIALDPTPAINAGNDVIAALSCVVLVRAIAKHA